MEMTGYYTQREDTKVWDWMVYAGKDLIEKGTASGWYSLEEKMDNMNKGIKWKEVK